MLASSCQEIPEGMISIDDVAKNPLYANLSLMEVDWGFVGYGVDGSKRLKLPVTQFDDCSYSVSFLSGGEVNGRTCPNIVFGSYTLDDSINGIIQIENFKVATLAGEKFDPWYFDRMEAVHFYQLTEIGLKLYYDGGKEFLLFTVF